VSRAAVLLVTLLGGSACVYYNAMWSAERLANDARRAEAQGGDARGYWARAAVKAESVAARHPRSRWAGPALVLQGEGLARSGACDRAAAPLAQALQVARDEPLRERAALVLAECALDANDPGDANRQLAGVTQSSDAARRSHAAFLAGRAAELAGDVTSAAESYGRSGEPAAAPARVRVLLGAGRREEALALLDAIAERRVRDGDWAPLLEAVARAAGPDTASRALERLLARSRLPAGARARLLLADGDRLFAAGRAPAAAARYTRIVDLVPDSLEAQLARVRELRVRAAQADSMGDLVTVRARLGALAQGAAAGDARALGELLGRVLATPDVDVGGQFRTAELIRDSVGAAHLAGRAFAAFAREHPASLFAPKAVVAALTLLPDARDSLVSVLDSRYATSPYTLALHGDASAAFAAAEDSLAQTLGVEPAALPGLLFVTRVAPPVPGPRGPWLDPAPVAALAALPPAGRPRRAPRTSGERDDAPVARPRPGSQPRDSL